MKKTAAIFLSVLMLLFCGIPALALEYKEYNATFELPQEYVEISSENASEYEEVLKYMGHTVSSFKKHISKNNILLFAILKDNSRQIQLKTEETQFSQDAKDISLLEDDNLKSVGEKIVGDTASNWNIIDTDGVVYFEIISQAKTQDETCSIQYVTIKNGLLYSLVLYGDTKQVDDSFINEGRQMLSLLKISAQKEKITASDADTVMEIVLIFALMCAAVAVAVIIIVSFVKDANKKKNNDSDLGDLTIQRRRYK